MEKVIAVLIVLWAGRELKLTSQGYPGTVPGCFDKELWLWIWSVGVEWDWNLQFGHLRSSWFDQMSRPIILGLNFRPYTRHCWIQPLLLVSRSSFCVNLIGILLNTQTQTHTHTHTHTHILGDLKKMEIIFFTVLESRSPWSRWQQIQCLLRTLFLSCIWLMFCFFNGLSLVCVHRRREREREREREESRGRKREGEGERGRKRKFPLCFFF